jgi:hypothetical protein
MPVNILMAATITGVDAEIPSPSAPSSANSASPTASSNRIWRCIDATFGYAMEGDRAAKERYIPGSRHPNPIADWMNANQLLIAPSIRSNPWPNEFW